jgi:hypothetical protein
MLESSDQTNAQQKSFEIAGGTEYIVFTRISVIWKGLLVP